MEGMNISACEQRHGDGNYIQGRETGEFSWRGEFLLRMEHVLQWEGIPGNPSWRQARKLGCGFIAQFSTDGGESWY